VVPVKSLSCHCSRDASSALLASFLAYGRQQLRGNQADNIVPEVQQSPEQMKVCATSEGAKSENAEISNPSTHQNDDSSASPSLATHSEGGEQKVLHRSQKRNRFRAKQRKRRGQKGKRRKKPRRSRASEKSDAEMDVDSSESHAPLSMDEDDATGSDSDSRDDSDAASETTTSSSDEDDEILENLQKYVGKRFVTMSYAAAMGKEVHSVVTSKVHIKARNASSMEAFVSGNSTTRP